jgi:hypothetical protein
LISLKGVSIPTPKKEDGSKDKFVGNPFPGGTKEEDLAQLLAHKLPVGFISNSYPRNQYPINQRYCDKLLAERML